MLIASRLVHNAPEPLAVMQVLVQRLQPLSLSGSTSTLLQTSATLLDQFDVQGDAGLAAFIDAQRVSLQRQARDYLEWETTLDRDRDERFE